MLAIFGEDFEYSRYAGRINGKQAVVSISSDELLASPAWYPDKEDEPPIPIGKAVRLAKQAIIERMPEFRENLQSAELTVELVKEHHAINSGTHYTDKFGKSHFHKNKIEFVFDRWVYWVRLSWPPIVSEGPIIYPTVPVAVLMNEKTFVAEETKNK